MVSNKAIERTEVKGEIILAQIRGLPETWGVVLQGRFPQGQLGKEWWGVKKMTPKWGI